MSAFSEAQRVEQAKIVLNEMRLAHNAMQAFNERIAAVYAGWTAYVNLENDETRLEESRAEFAMKARHMVDANKVQLAASLDIIGGGMRDAHGFPVVRSELLNEIDQIPRPGQ